MTKLIRISYLWSIAVLLSVGLTFSEANAQEQIGGPYEADSATMLLLHFDGDFTNASDSSADAEGHGTVEFQDEAPKDGLGQSARIDNSSPADSSYITVPHSESLSLTGSWTIEGWINIFTFGTGSDSYKWVPRLINKPGEEVFYTGNYYMEMWGSNRYFKAGYHTTASGDGDWIEVNSPFNLMQIGNWYHWAYIRDAQNNVLISVIHELQSNGDMERVFFGVNPYDPIAESPPLTNDNAIHIGFAGGGDDSFLDGWVDEIRVSNVVRNYDIPPIFTSISELSNQETGSDYPVSVQAYKLGTNQQVDEVNVHYRIDGEGDFQTMQLSEDTSRTYSGSIPEQSTGSTVDYYYSATGSGGSTAYYPNTVLQDSSWLSFGVVDPQSQTLSLSFESGNGTPVDSSSYNNTIEFEGSPSYSTDAASGQYSLDFEGDSSRIVTSSPFYSSQQMQLELWFKPDSIPATNTRLAVNAGSPWWQSNFEIKFLSGGVMTGGSYVPNIEDPTPFIMDEMVLDSSVTPNVWNKVIYQVSNDTAIVQLFDENENFVDESIFRLQDDENPILTAGPVYIGGVDSASNPYFDGKVDNVRLYNYAKDDLKIHTDIKRQGNDLPRQVKLRENYPNPFNPTTNISYTLPVSQQVTLKVYDVLGREVATLVDGVKQSGQHTVSFDAANLSSGVYLYKLKTPQTTKTSKMLLVK